MARYDVSLADERGAVRADQHRDWSDFRARRSGRGFDPRRATAWRKPADLRGYHDADAVRGGGWQERQAYRRGYGTDFDIGSERGPRRSGAWQPFGGSRRPDAYSGRPPGGDRYDLAFRRFRSGR